MNVDHGVMLFAIRALAAILILSSLYPASRLLKSSNKFTRLVVVAIAVLSLTAPILLMVASRMRVTASNDARVLQQMNVQISSLPALYLLTVSAAAIILWLAWLATKRTAA